MPRRKRTTWIVASGLVLLLAGGLAWTLEASEEEKPTSLQTSAERSRGGDSDEVTADSVSNDAESPQPAPPNKAEGEMARGGGYTCLFGVDNWTPWYIEIYVNGEYNGTVAPWGEWAGWRTEGSLRMFARAVFVDGSVLTWGPADAYCGASFTWRLDP